MKIDIFQVNAFTSGIFSGSTSAVCPLSKEISSYVMQKIASQTNLSKTAFIRKIGEKEYEARWFTPRVEISINDHAALASAYVIFNFLEKDIDEVYLKCINQTLKIKREDSLMSLSFKYQMPKLFTENNPIFEIALGKAPLKILKDKDYILIYDNQEIVENINPKIDVLKNINLRGVCITSKTDDGKGFVFKYFAPKLSMKENLVTGSLCSQLTPYWSQFLKQNSLTALQISNNHRQSKILCDIVDDKVVIKGEAKLFMKGEIILEERKVPREGQNNTNKLAVAV